MVSTFTQPVRRPPAAFRGFVIASSKNPQRNTHQEDDMTSPPAQLPADPRRADDRSPSAGRRAGTPRRLTSPALGGPS